jgi:hypothetical protein
MSKTTEVKECGKRKAGQRKKPAKKHKPKFMEGVHSPSH